MEKVPVARDNTLDAWRGVSILLVLVHHLVYFHYPVFRNFAATAQTGLLHIVWLFDKGLVAFAERSGPLGVKFFFVISGFIITKLMLDEERKRGSFSLYHFYVRRAVRILPPLVFYLALVFALGLFGWTLVTSTEILHSVSFLCNTNIGCGWDTIHTWTLATEMQFYLFWPLLFLLTPKRFRLLMLTLTMVLLMVCSALGILTTQGWLDNAISFVCIGLGALIASSEPVRTFFIKRSFVLMGTLAGVVIALVLLHLSDAARIAYREAIPFVIAGLIFSSYRFPRLAKTRFVSVLASLGLISYSLYLWQQVFLAPPEQFPVESLLLQPLLMFAFAIVSYFVIEQPAVRLGKKFLKGRTKEAPVENVSGI